MAYSIRWDCADMDEGADTQRMLSALSHDLRAPMENVISLAQMSLDELSCGRKEGGAVAASCLKEIILSMQALESLAGELVPRERRAARTERFDARRLADSLSALLSCRAQQLGLTLVIDVSGLGTTVYRGDFCALMRILSNLIGNALKYTPRGGRVSLRAEAERGCGRVNARFIVEDNGMGISEAFLPALCEPYARAQQAKESGIPGQGLGMSIVRRMAQRMNGTIQADSELNRGTRLCVTVPLEAERGAGGSGCLLGRRIVLAEDNDLSAAMEKALLERAGARVVRTADGGQAVKAFSMTREGETDAILLDLHMPGMDGCAAARAIRALKRGDARSVKVIALTAGADVREHELAMAAGADGVLMKPMDVSELAGIIG